MAMYEVCRPHHGKIVRLRGTRVRPRRGLADANQFLYARHLFEGAWFDLALVAGDADGGALRPGHGVGPVAQFFDLLTYGAHLLFRGVRLHNYQHDPTSKRSSLSLVYRSRQISPESTGA